jgi:hypothetical protein
MNKLATIPAGKTLYHGTNFKFPTGIPVGNSGIWFATNPIQSILHVSAKGGWATSTKPLYFYIYKTIKPIKVLKFDSSKNMNNWALRSGFPATKNTYAFSNKDYELAKYLCEQGIYDGWWFPNDQSQVMLCKPSELLRFVKVMEITFPYGRPSRINFNKVNNTGKYVVSETGRKYKYKLVNTTLNELINLKAPPKNAIYSMRKAGVYNRSLLKYFNHLGRPLQITHAQTQSNNGFNINGKKYFTGQTSSVNRTHQNTLVKRIINQTSTNISPMNYDFQQITLMTPNQKAEKDRRAQRIKANFDLYRQKYFEYMNEVNRRKKEGLSVKNLTEPVAPTYTYNSNKKSNYLPLPEPRKTMNNININASALYSPISRRKSKPTRYGTGFK